VRALACLAWAGSALLASALPSQAQLVIFEAPGLTLGNDPVECAAAAGYRICQSDAATERVLSHDGLPAGERIPLDFQLLLPPAPGSGPDGRYPLVVFIHGWNGHKNSIGGGLESEFVPYAQAGYAVLAYSARAWGNSCGSSQQTNPECANQWNHLADVRFEVRDTQYFAGLLADELSDDGTPLVDGNKVGVTGVSYGGGQSTMLAGLRNRVVDLDGSLLPWTSPAGKPMQIAAAAPFWAWTDLSYSLLPNGRTLDYVSNNSYYGPNANHPIGVLKSSYVAGLYATGHANSVFAPPGEDPPLDLWFQMINAGEPYTATGVGAAADEIIQFHSGYYRIDPVVPPAPILFNSGWSDDLFPVDEPLRWIHRAKTLHPGLQAHLVASDYGHARASSDDAAFAKAAAREWFDRHLLGIGGTTHPAIRARLQDCAGTGAPEYGAATWEGLSPGEVRFQSAGGGTVVSSGGPSAESASAFDPISGADACARVADAAGVGTLSFDLGPGGYTLLGSPTLIADLTVSGGPAENTLLAVRLLDIAPDDTELLLARAIYRPDASGQQVFQLHPIGSQIAADHHLQLELLGHEAPTMRQSNTAFTISVANLDLRLPVAENPNGGQIGVPAPKVVPAGYLLLPFVALPALLPLALAGLTAALLASGWRALRSRARGRV
jgi:dienelactone hydrolase